MERGTCPVSLLIEQWNFCWFIPTAPLNRISVIDWHMFKVPSPTELNLCWWCSSLCWWPYKNKVGSKNTECNKPFRNLSLQMEFKHHKTKTLLIIRNNIKPPCSLCAFQAQLYPIIGRRIKLNKYNRLLILTRVILHDMDAISGPQYSKHSWKSSVCKKCGIVEPVHQICFQCDNVHQRHHSSEKTRNTNEWPNRGSCP